MIFDIHTHDLERENAIVNLPLGDVSDVINSGTQSSYYSVGIHPWDAEKIINWESLEALIHHPRVVAVGEVGLDSACGVDINVQTKVFIRQVELAEEYGKPLILHVVRRWDEVMEIKKSLKSSVPWIIHGFRGKVEQAQQLLRGGFSLSFGEKFNVDTMGYVRSRIADGSLDPMRILMESDESKLSIEDIARKQQMPLRDFSPLFDVY